MIFNIQRFSTHDGEGIRTNVFFKGCPLRCLWCSNPESQVPEPEILYDPSKCIGCGECVKKSVHGAFTCRDGQIYFDRTKVRDAEVFRDICPTMAIEVCGRAMSVEKVMEEVKKDLPFYKKSGGGVTVTGGEPFYHPDILLDLLIELKELNINTAVETCLDVPWEDIEAHVSWLDSFLADLKHVDHDRLDSFTKGNAERIMDNFRRLDQAGANVIVRVPVIPGFNENDKDLTAIIDFAAELDNVHEIHLLPYHTYGSKKYGLLGMPYEGAEERMDESQLSAYIDYAKGLGLKAQIGG